MKMALSARLTIDPQRLLRNRWVHDTAHRIITSVRKAKGIDIKRALSIRH
jgi:hypothetical protein